MLTVLRHKRDSEPLSERTMATGRQCLALARRVYDAQHAFVPTLMPQALRVALKGCEGGMRAYDLDDDLTPNMEHLENLLRIYSGTRKFVVVIHYCGYKTPTDQIAALCHDYRAVLVEDCAQAVVGPASTPEHADVWFYSFNKFLPVSDGATINSRRLDIDVGWNGATPPPTLPIETLLAYRSHMECNRRLALATDRKTAEEWEARSASEYNRYYESAGFIIDPHQISDHSARWLQNFRAEALNALRGSNAKMLRDKLPPSLLWRDGEPAMCFPIRCNGKRDEIDETLREHGIFASRFADKWFGIDCEFGWDHLLLPLGNGINEGEINLMANVLEAFK